MVRVEHPLIRASGDQQFGRWRWPAGCCTFHGCACSPRLQLPTHGGSAVWPRPRTFKVCYRRDRRRGAARCCVSKAAKTRQPRHLPIHLAPCGKWQVQRAGARPDRWQRVRLDFGGPQRRIVSAARRHRERVPRPQLPDRPRISRAAPRNFAGLRGGARQQQHQPRARALGGLAARRRHRCAGPEGPAPSAHRALTTRAPASVRAGSSSTSSRWRPAASARLQAALRVRRSTPMPAAVPG